MRRFFVSIFVGVLIHSFYSQGFQRHYKIPTSLNNSAKSLFETSLGNYVLCGLTVDTINNFQTNRLSILGLNSQGQVQWVKKYGNKKFEYLDNQLISKWFYRKGNYIYHAGCVRDSNNKFLGVLIKFDLVGDTIWQKKFYDPVYDVIPQGVTSSVDGGFLITGFFQTSGSNPCLLIKTDGNGNELWRKKINKPVPNVHDGKQIAQDSATKKIVIVGYQNLGNASSWITADNILICDSLGNKLSQTSLSGTSNGGLLLDLIQTKDKDIVAVGSAIYPQTLGGSNMTKSYMIKFDLNNPNTFIWRINDFDTLSLDNTCTGVLEKPNGDLIVEGTIEREHKKNLPFNYLNRLSWLSSGGTVINNKNYQYSTNTANDYFQIGQTIAFGSNGSILAAFQLYNTSPNPMFFVRYDSIGCDSSTFYCQSMGLTNHNKAYSPIISVFPNPVTSKMKIKISKDLYKAEINICDVLGRKTVVLKREYLNAESGIEFDLADMKNGIYFLRLYCKDVLIENIKFLKHE